MRQNVVRSYQSRLVPPPSASPLSWKPSEGRWGGRENPCCAQTFAFESPGRCQAWLPRVSPPCCSGARVPLPAAALPGSPRLLSSPLAGWAQAAAPPANRWRAPLVSAMLRPSRKGALASPPTHTHRGGATGGGSARLGVGISGLEAGVGW